jgi:hypothetical protein
MSETLMLAGGLVGLLFFLLWQRVPATILFFSLLVGQVLSTEISGEVFSWAAAALRIQDYGQVQLGLLVLPPLLTILFLRHRAAKSKAFIEFIPMIFFVTALAIFAYPHVPAIQSALETITNHRVETYKNVIVAAASLSSLLSAWFTYPGIGLRGKHRK